MQQLKEEISPRSKVNLKIRINGNEPATALNEYGMKVISQNQGKALNNISSLIQQDIQNYVTAQPLSATIKQPLVLP